MAKGAIQARKKRARKASKEKSRQKGKPAYGFARKKPKPK